MNWITTSIILIMASTCLYLLLRNIDKYNTSINIRSIVMFGFPIIPLFCYNKVYGVSFQMEFLDILILFFAAIFFAWLANIASLKALKNAPNPGYPLILGKSYVIYTTIFSVFFLESELSYFKLGIILTLLLFVSLMLFDGNKVKNHTKGKINHKTWIYLALFTFFAWGNLALILTYLSNKGVPTTTINLYLMVFVSIFIIGEILYQKQKICFKNKNEILNLIFIGVAFTIFQQSMIHGFSVAPNPGYINAVNVASIGFVTILSGIIFKDNLEKQKLIGVAGIIVCLGLLFI